MSRKFWILGGAALGILATGGAYLLRAQSATATVTLVADPGIVIVNTPTQVKFTATVTTGPSQTISGVNLLRIGATGSSSVAATMRDDGTAGDAVAGDKIFTVILSLDEGQVETFGYQGSAALRGQIRRTLSDKLPFATLAPVSVPVILPPDPGEAGKATVTGVDSDGDGVRDDLQRYIVFTHPESESTRQAMRQQSSANQYFVEATTSAGALLAAQTRARSQACILYLLGVSIATKEQMDELRAQLLNTPERALAYLAADKLLTGATIWGIPDDQKKLACAFDPGQLEN